METEMTKTDETGEVIYDPSVQRATKTVRAGVLSSLERVSVLKAPKDSMVVWVLIDTERTEDLRSAMIATEIVMEGSNLHAASIHTIAIRRRNWRMKDRIAVMD
jgi:hypothetical protein